MIDSRIQAIDSVGDPPLPIPNREVKPDSADGTALSCGRVGHRHFFPGRALADAKALLFLCFFLGALGTVRKSIPLIDIGPVLLH